MKPIPFLSKKQAPVSHPVSLAFDHQPFVLQQKMTAANMSHGQTVRANIRNLKVVEEKGSAKAYFCFIDDLEILAKHTPGDGGIIPLSVAPLQNIALQGKLKSGYYNLKNVVLASNGQISVNTTMDTELVFVKAL